MTQAIERQRTEVLTLEQLVEYTGYSLPELAEMRKPGGVAAGADNAGLITFCLRAHADGLDPRKRQCYYVQRAGKWSYQTGIDGFAAIADRTGKFAGIDPVDYRGQVELKDGSRTIIAPAEATATVWKLVGQSEQVRPFRATVHWEEFYPGSGEQGFMYRAKPRLMLGKCARAQALRMAFPQQLGDADLVDDENQRGRVLDVSEQRPPPAPVPQLEQPKKTYDDIFPDDDQARSDRETAKAKGIVERAQTASQAATAAQRQLEIAEVDRQRREEGLKG